MKTRRGGGVCGSKPCKNNTTKTPGSVPMTSNPMRSDSGSGAGAGTGLKPFNFEKYANEANKQAKKAEANLQKARANMKKTLAQANKTAAILSRPLGPQMTNTELEKAFANLDLSVEGLGPGAEVNTNIPDMLSSVEAYTQFMYEKEYKNLSPEEKEVIDSEFKELSQAGGGGCFGGLCSGNKSSVNESAHETPTNATGVTPMTQNPMTKKTVTAENINESLTKLSTTLPQLRQSVEKAKKDVSEAQGIVNTHGENLKKINSAIENTNKQPESSEKQEKLQNLLELQQKINTKMIKLITDIAAKNEAIAKTELGIMSLEIKRQQLAVAKVGLNSKKRKEERNAAKTAGTGLKGGNRKQKTNKTKKNKNKRN